MMVTAEELDSLDLNSLLDLLGEITRENVSEFVNDPLSAINDGGVFFANLVIKEIEMRKSQILDPTSTPAAM